LRFDTISTLEWLAGRTRLSIAPGGAAPPLPRQAAAAGSRVDDPAGHFPARAAGPAGGSWIDLVEECVELFDELDTLAGRLDPPRREMAEQVSARVQDILERAGVAAIEGETAFDRRRHRPEPNEVASEGGARVTETLSPGFAIAARVLRRARVRLASTR
jgi:hypothetical protein